MGRKRTKPRKQTEFSKKLHQIRKTKKITMTKLSKQINMSDSYISLLESGERKPSRDVVLKLSKAFFPDGNEQARDELLILAGFTPINTDSLKLPPTPIDLISEYEMTLKDNPNDFKLFMLLIRTLIKEKQYTKAQSRLTKGMQIFGSSVQLQTMLAHLELTKGNHIGAIVAQEAAIRHYNLSDATEHGRLTMTDLLANLSIIHFLKGDRHLSEMLEAEYNHQQESMVASRTLAQKHFIEASNNLEQALQQAPDNLSLLDDYARVNFNLADLAIAGEEQGYWQNTIKAYRQILACEDKAQLGEHILTEVIVFLAHAYTKNSQFDLASYTLDLLTTFRARHWLVHYVKACFYCLKFESDNQEHYLEQALTSLRQAVIADKDRVLSQAEYDRDLKVLRDHRLNMLKDILVGE